MKFNAIGPGSITASLAMAVVFAAGAAAQAPTSTPAKSSTLKPAELTAPAGGSANPDVARRRPREVVPQGPTPRLADGHPDLSGVWNGGGPVGDLAQGLAPGETIPLLPAAKALMDKRQSKDDPEANCLPTGIPRIAPYPWRIVQTPTHIFFLFEGNIHSYRQIFMNGTHPADPDPSWYGHSIGTWEGDTLVVDTVGSTINSGSIFAAIRIPNSCTPSNATRARIWARWRTKSPSSIQATTPSLSRCRSPRACVPRKS